MRIKILKIKNYRSRFIEEKPTFYKYTVINGEPAIPAESLQERIFMPWNKKYDSKENLLKFLIDVMPSLVSPGSNCLLFYQFFRMVWKSVHGKKLSYSHLLKMHTVSYHTMMDRKLGIFKEERNVKYLSDFKTYKKNKKYYSFVFKTFY